MFPAYFTDGSYWRVLTVHIASLEVRKGSIAPFGTPSSNDAICAFETFERRLESTLTGHSFSGISVVCPANVAGSDVVYSSGSPALRTPSNALGRFGECATVHLTVSLELMRRASAKEDLASSILPSSA